MTESDLGPRVALSWLSLKKAQKAFQVGIEYLARNLVMQQGACEFGNPGRRLTGFDYRWINQDHRNPAFLSSAAIATPRFLSWKACPFSFPFVLVDGRSSAKRILFHEFRSLFG
jgi:hypothetical protein